MSDEGSGVSEAIRRYTNQWGLPNKINLNKFSESKSAIIPIINGRGKYQGRRIQVDAQDDWYKFKLRDGVSINRRATDIEILEACKKLKVISGYVFGQEIVPLHFNMLNGEAETARVHFLEGSIWDIVQAVRWEDGNYFYNGLDYSFSLENFLETKNRFENNLSLEGVKNVTPELRFYFVLLSLERDNFREVERLESLSLLEDKKIEAVKKFQESLASRLETTITDAGGHLVRFHRQGQDIVVIWSVDGKQYNSLIRNNLDFRAREVGFCCSGADKQHTLGSAINLVQDYNRRGDYYDVTRS